MPSIYYSEEADEDLESCVDTYLREEIKAEAVTRNVGAFSEFLDIIARSNGQELNYESFAADLQVSASTLKNYVQILEDTLIGFRVPGFTETRKHKATSRAKHYLFDLGVTRHLARISWLDVGSNAFGNAFEHFIILEVRAYLAYRRVKQPLSYWRTTSQFEVDLLIGKTVAIEIKATSQPSSKHLKGLLALKEEAIFQRYLLVCTCEDERRTSDGIETWQVFTERLWEGNLIEV